MDFREPFDTQKNPSLSSQLFKAAPGVFGGKDGINPLQTANRVIVGGPIDIFDLVGRVGEAGLMGLSQAVGEGYEALGGGQGMSERLKRDIYGLGQIGGMMAGSSPSALSGARVPSTRRAAPSDSTLSGARKAFGNEKEVEAFKKEFEYDVYHGQRDPEVSIGVTKSRDGREMLVEDATGEYGGINAFESSADKFPSHYPTDLGTFVSESRDVANYFAGDRGAVYPLKMRMKNPMRYETYEDLEDALDEVGDTSELTKRLMDEGYDGIEITYSDTDIPEIRRDFIPFEGKQLRSKYAEFDPEKRDLRNITYKQGGIVYNPFKAGIGAL